MRSINLIKAKLKTINDVSNRLDFCGSPLHSKFRSEFKILLTLLTSCVENGPGDLSSEILTDQEKKDLIGLLEMDTVLRWDAVFSILKGVKK